VRRLIAAIVDDDETSVEIVAGICSKHGFDPVVYKSGLEAIFGLEFVRPDILIADMHMPNMDGDGLLWQLAEPPFDFSDIPIMILTGDENYNASGRHTGLNVRVVFKRGGLRELGSFLDTHKTALLDRSTERAAGPSSSDQSVVVRPLDRGRA